MNDPTTAPTEVPVIAPEPQDPRHRAIDRYRSTNLTVSAIAAEVGVSRDTVYRWLRKEGVPIGRNGSSDLPSDDFGRISDEVSEIRREQIILIGRVARLEGLIEALVGVGSRLPGIGVE